MKPPSFLRGLRLSFCYAGRGLWRTLRTQPNARIHLGAAIAALALGWGLGVPTGQMAVLVLAITLVFLAEVLNTVIEITLDLAHPAHHPAVGWAKDAAAGAVLLCALAAVVVGLFVLLPPLVLLAQRLLDGGVGP